jgi:CHASE3 domain sensor protein
MATSASQTISNQAVNQITLSDYATRLAAYVKTSPGQLTAALTACILGAIIMAFASWHSYAGLRHSVQTVGKDTVPSIVAAQHIRSLLADANANVMNAILTREPAGGVFMKEYRRELNDVTGELVTAIQNITYGDEEKKPLLMIMQNLSEYQRFVGAISTKTGAAEINDILAANALMRDKVLAAASELDQANFKHLDETFTAHKSHLFVSMAPFIFGLFLFLGALGWTQFLLFKKTHRVINPGFAVATMVAIVFALYSGYMLKSTESALKVAKADAFDSIHALWKARAIAYDANADESLYLIYHGSGDAQEKATAAFRAKVGDILNKNGKNGSQYGGFLGEELANITFEGEKEAAADLISTFSEYLKIDGKIRELEKSGQYKEALALNIGTKPGESNWAYDRFDKALGKTIDINQKEFDSNVSKAFSELNVFPYVLGIVLVIVIVASVVGMKPRLDEYRF